MQAGLAAHAAAVAAEAVDVGPAGVVGHAARLGVERILLVYVIIVPVPGEGGTRTHTQTHNQWTARGVHLRIDSWVLVGCPPARDESPGTGDGTQHGREGTGRQQGEQTEV